MVAALLPVEPFQLRHEDAHEHVLVLEVILAEAELHVLEVREQHEEELQRWVHCELSEKDR